MRIVHVLILRFILKLIFKGLFNEKRYKEKQQRVNNIKNEQFFRNLMQEKYETKTNVIGVFELYLLSNREPNVGWLMSVQERISKQHNLSKDIIHKNRDCYKNIEIINNEIDKRDENIQKILKKYPFKVNKDDLQKALKTYEKEKLFLSNEVLDRVNKLISYLRVSNSGSQVELVWEEIKKLENEYYSIEYDPTGNTRIDSFKALKQAESILNEVIVKLFHDKIPNTEASKKLKLLLEEREQLKMLRRCIVDYSMWGIWTNLYQRAFWRFVSNYLVW